MYLALDTGPRCPRCDPLLATGGEVLLFIICGFENRVTAVGPEYIPFSVIPLPLLVASKVLSLSSCRLLSSFKVSWLMP